MTTAVARRWSGSGFYLVEAILGAAFGIYMGVDLALVLAVLPHPEDNAKDLGVFNIANAMPQTLAPFLGAACCRSAQAARTTTSCTSPPPS
jgi:hypothetical protein